MYVCMYVCGGGRTRITGGREHGKRGEIIVPTKHVALPPTGKQGGDRVRSFGGGSVSSQVTNVLDLFVCLYCLRPVRSDPTAPAWMVMKRTELSDASRPWLAPWHVVTFSNC